MFPDMPAEGHGLVELRTGKDEAGMSFICVEDPGPGTPSDVLRPSFDMFWRSERTGSRNAKGTGLTVVRAIADAHGAELSVRNRPSGGACRRSFTSSIAFAAP